MQTSTELQTSTETMNRTNSTRYRLLGIIGFFMIAIIGLYLAKWNPYYNKAFIAIQKHSIGASIISGKTNAAPTPSWNAAWQFSVSYYQAIWQALVVGVVLGSLIQILVPKDWIIRLMGHRRFSGTAIAGLAALPGMMCTCCAAPMVVGLRKQTSSVGAAVAFWFGNTALNPAVLVFMTFVLSWKYTIIRLIFGIILVFGVAYLANRFDTGQFTQDTKTLTDILSRHESRDTERFWVIRWLRSMFIMLIQVIPVYFISVLLLGMIRAWLFPELSPVAAQSILAIIGFAIAGTLFVIPTAGEIPIIQTLQQFGLGMGPAAALLITLPVISLPSMLMVRRVFSLRILGFLSFSVIISGILAGLLAQFIF